MEKDMSRVLKTPTHVRPWSRRPLSSGRSRSNWRGLRVTAMAVASRPSWTTRPALTAFASVFITFKA